MSELSKAITVGLLLSGFVGIQVLTRAVQSIKERPPSQAPTVADAEAIKRDLAADRGTSAQRE